MRERSLLYIEKILEEKSFSKAAQKLYIAQPSLSQYIKKIENEMGIELFDRESNPLKLTYAGEIYLQTEKRIQQLERERLQAIEDIYSLKKGHVIIGSSYNRSSFFLTKVFPVFHKDYPGIEIRLEEGTTAELEEFAENGVTDFSIVLLPLTSTRLVYEEIFQEEILLAVSQKHPLCRFVESKNYSCPPYPPIDISLFRDEPFIIMKPGQNLRQLFFTLCKNAHFKPNIVLETKSMETAQALAAVDVGVTLVPDFLASNNHLSKSLCYFSLKDQISIRHVVIAYSTEKYFSKSARAFAEVCKDVARTQMNYKKSWFENNCLKP